MKERREGWISLNVRLIIIAGIIAIAPTLLAVATLVTSIKNVKKTEEVHVLVNSNLSKVQEKLDVALDRIFTLERRIAAMNLRKANEGK